MTLDSFLQRLADSPETIGFDDTMEMIDRLYEFTPVSFNNGGMVNAAGQNSGSCKLFAFARLHKLTEQQTLACFGRYYRHDVLQNPDGDDHRNIRRFMQTGWAGIRFDRSPLTPFNPHEDPHE